MAEILETSLTMIFSDKIFESVGPGWHENKTTGDRMLLGRESRATDNLISANELTIIQTKRGGELLLITLVTKVEPEWVK